MKPLRQHVAIAIDGGGIKGAMVARALAMLEEHLGTPVHDIFRLATGTSTGAIIISAGIAAGLTAARMFQLYNALGETVFRRSLRSRLWPLTRYRYPLGPLREALEGVLGDARVGALWCAEPATDLVITAFDLVEERARFIKPWKEEYAHWSLVTAVLASCSVPTYFPPVKGRYVDGGVGSYANPCYVAAYEARFCLGWDLAETTLISLGTGRNPKTRRPGDADRYYAWDWLEPILGAFLQSAYDQQVHLVKTFFKSLDFRRFQVDLDRPIAMDDPASLPLLAAYGEELGRKMLNDETDPALEIRAGRATGGAAATPAEPGTGSMLGNMAMAALALARTWRGARGARSGEQ
jgi:predicted acylesterase/phospholipase RssA